MQQSPYPQQQYPQGQYPQQQHYPQQGQYPQAQGQYPQAQGQYPQAQGQYPQAQGQYPQAQGQPPPPVQYVSPQVQTNVVYQTAPARSTSKTWDSYNGSASRVLGIIQIVVGFLCIIFNAVGMAMQTERINSGGYSYTSIFSFSDTTIYRSYDPNAAFYVASGIWCTIFFFISGGLAIGAGNSKTSGLIIGSMVMSIISSLFALVLLGTAAAAVGVEKSGYYNEDWHMVHYPNDNIHKTSLVMGVLLLLLSILEIIVAITASGYACAAVCCGRRTQTTSGQVIQAGTTQYMMQPQAVGMQQVAPQPMAPQQMAPQPTGYGQAQPMYNPAYQQPQQPGEPVKPNNPGVQPQAPPAYESLNPTAP